MRKIAIGAVCAMACLTQTAEARYLHMAGAKAVAKAYVGDSDGSRVSRCVRVSSTGAYCQIASPNVEFAGQLWLARWTVWVSVLGTRKARVSSSLDR